jgi:hypothetical protein
VGQIANFTRGGNTSIKEVMKTLSYLKVAKSSREGESYNDFPGIKSSI